MASLMYILLANLQDVERELACAQERYGGVQQQLAAEQAALTEVRAEAASLHFRFQTQLQEVFIRLTCMNAVMKQGIGMGPAFVS
jgi:hypothetical protein